MSDGGLTIDMNLTVADGALRLDGAARAETAVRLDVSAALDASDARALADAGDARPSADTGDARALVDASDARALVDARDARAPVDAGDGRAPADADAKSPGDSRDAPQRTDVPDASIAIDSPGAIDTAAQDGGGAIDTAPNGCQNPIEIPLDQPYVELPLTTTGESHDFKLTCAVGGNDIVLSFYLDRSEMVYADTFGSTWDTLLAFSLTCPLTSPAPYAGIVSCNDNACGTKQSQVFAIMPNGRHYLVLSGNNGESGSVTLHFQHAPIAAGPSAPLPAGSGTMTGTTSGPTRLSDCEASGPENGYWWTSCPDYTGGPFTASTCTGTSFNVVLAMQIPREGGGLVCANSNSCGAQESMTATIPPGAGIHYLAVDGDAVDSAGAYTLTYTRP